VIEAFLRLAAWTRLVSIAHERFRTRAHAFSTSPLWRRGSRNWTRSSPRLTATFTRWPTPAPGSPKPDRDASAGVGLGLLAMGPARDGSCAPLACRGQARECGRERLARSIQRLRNDPRVGEHRA